ncbi:hypothetical protein HK102_006373 [Quaeritorhiza haematococci]|nr:hypothetical protein HK102_006373 [Quaeritorhiza haematococci]
MITVMPRKFSYIHMCIAASAFATREVLAAPISTLQTSGSGVANVNPYALAVTPTLDVRGLDTIFDVTSIIPKADSLVTGLSARQNIDIGTIINLISKIPFADILKAFQQLGGLAAGAAGAASAGEGAGGGELTSNLANLLASASASTSAPGSAAAGHPHKLLARSPQLENIDIQSIISIIQKIPFADILKAFQQLGGLAGGAAGGAGGAELTNLVGTAAGAAGAAHAHKLLARQNIDIGTIVNLISKIPFADILKAFQQLGALAGGAGGAGGAAELNFANLANLDGAPQASSGSGPAAAAAPSHAHKLLAREPQLENIDPQKIIALLQRIPIADIMKVFQQLGGLAGASA